MPCSLFGIPPHPLPPRTPSWIEEFDECLVTFFGLQDLFYHQKPLHSLMLECVAQVSPSIRYAGAFGYVASDFPTLETKFWPVDVRAVS